MILVTGGMGYIGSQTIIQLIKNGYDVICIDDFRNSKESVLNRVEEISGEEIINYPCDITDINEIRPIFESTQIDSVIHFASDKSVTESVIDPIKYFHNNLNGLTNIVKLCGEFGVKKLIFSSSASVYGDVETCPIGEDSEMNPVSPYGLTKKMGEDILEKIDFMDIVCLRYFNPVGADSSYLIGEDNDSPQNLVPIICQVASGQRKELNIYGDNYDTKDGTCIRDYIHIMDLANAHIQSLNYIGTNTFNIGTGTGYTVSELVNTFEQVNGLKLNYKIVGRRKGDVSKIYSDTQKMESELGFKCQYGLGDMLKSAWEWEKNRTKLNEKR